MNIKNLQEQILKADKISIGIDFLRLNLKFKIPSLSDILNNKIDDDNSNVVMMTIGKYPFSIVKNYTTNGPALSISASINNYPYTLFQYLEYTEQKQKTIKSSGYFVYYSTYFRLLDMLIIDSSFEKHFLGDELDILLSSGISRIDYKIDFFYNNPTNIIKIEDIIEYRSNYKMCNYALDGLEYDKHQNILFQRLKENKVIHYDIKTDYRVGDFQNGWTIGNKKNKSLFIRCYEKNIDSISKGKAMLYSDYLDYKNVFRLEIEFLTKFNKKDKKNPFKYNEISELVDKIKRFMGLSEKIDDEKFLYQYRKDKNEKKDEDEVKLLKLKNLREFGGRGLTLYKQGFNPFEVLYVQLKNRIKEIKDFDQLVINFQRFIDRKNLNKTLSSKYAEEGKKKMKNLK